MAGVNFMFAAKKSEKYVNSKDCQKIRQVMYIQLFFPLYLPSSKCYIYKDGLRRAVKRTKNRVAVKSVGWRQGDDIQIYTSAATQGTYQLQARCPTHKCRYIASGYLCPFAALYLLTKAPAKRLGADQLCFIVG